jgi:hypothetical protein
MVGIDDTYVAQDANSGKSRNPNGRQRKAIILRQLVGQQVTVNRSGALIEGELRELRSGVDRAGFYVGSNFIGIPSIQRIYASDKKIELYGGSQ